MDGAFVGQVARPLRQRLYMHTPSANDEAQIIGQAQTKAGRLFMEAIYSDENSINRHTTLDPWYALIRDRLTR